MARRTNRQPQRRAGQQPQNQPVAPPPANAGNQPAQPQANQNPPPVQPNPPAAPAQPQGQQNQPAPQQPQNQQAQGAPAPAPAQQPPAQQPAPQQQRPAAPQPAPMPQVPVPRDINQLTYAGLDASIPSGLEAALVDRKSPSNYIGNYLQRSQRREPEAQDLARKALDDLKAALPWHYKALGFDGQALQDEVNRNIEILKNPQNPNYGLAARTLQAIAKRVYDITPGDKKAAWADKIYRQDFEGAFMLALDEWKKGSLLDNFEFGHLKPEYQSTFYAAIKEGKSMDALLAELQGYASRLKGAQNDSELASAIAEKIDGVLGKIKKTIEALLIGAYGFQKEVFEFAVAKGEEKKEIAAKRIIESAQYLAPLYNIAAKKVALTMGAEKTREAAGAHLEQRLRETYAVA